MTETRLNERPLQRPSILFATYFKYELIGYLREPAAVFFGTVFPLLLLLLLGNVFTGEIHGDIRFVDALAPGLVVMIAASLGVVSITVWMSEQRTLGYLRRHRVMPVSPAVYGGSQAMVAIAMFFISSTLLLIVTAIAFGIPTEINTLGFLTVSAVSIVPMFGIGILLGSLRIGMRSAQMVATIAFFVIMAGSGLAVAREQLSPWLYSVTGLLPMSTLMEAAVDTYALGGTLGGYVLPLLAMVVLGLAFGAAGIWRIAREDV